MLQTRSRWFTLSTHRLLYYTHDGGEGAFCLLLFALRSFPPAASLLCSPSTARTGELIAGTKLTDIETIIDIPKSKKWRITTLHPFGTCVRRRLLPVRGCALVRCVDLCVSLAPFHISSPFPFPRHLWRHGNDARGAQPAGQGQVAQRHDTGPLLAAGLQLQPRRARGAWQTDLPPSAFDSNNVAAWLILFFPCYRWRASCSRCSPLAPPVATAGAWAVALLCRRRRAGVLLTPGPPSPRPFPSARFRVTTRKFAYYTDEAGEEMGSVPFEFITQITIASNNKKDFVVSSVQPFTKSGSYEVGRRPHACYSCAYPPAVYAASLGPGCVLCCVGCLSQISTLAPPACVVCSFFLCLLFLHLPALPPPKVTCRCSSEQGRNKWITGLRKVVPTAKFVEARL